MAKQQPGNLPNIVVPPTGFPRLNGEALKLANLAAWHLWRIGNTGILAALPEPGSSAPMGTAANPIGVFERPWLQEPPGSIAFDEQDAANFLPGDVDLPVMTLNVPQGYDGVIKWVSNTVPASVGFTDFSGDLVWKLLQNMKPIRNFGNILAQKGTVAQGRAVSPIRIFSGDVLQYTISSFGLSGTTICSVTGYFYPARGVS